MTQIAFTIILVIINIVLLMGTFAMCELDRKDREFWLWLALGGVSFVDVFGFIIWYLF